MSDKPIEQDMDLTIHVERFINLVERAGANARRPKGGMQVPYHDDFANVTPSTLQELEWWVRSFKHALEGSDAKYCLDMTRNSDRSLVEGHFKCQALEVIRGMRDQLGAENATKLLREIAAIKPPEHNL